MKPSNINIYINNKCNLHCIYCYRKANNQPYNSYFKNFCRCINFIEKTTIKNITITGGEPLLDPYIKDYFREATKHNFSCSLLTNGTLIISSELLNFLNTITFSLDGNPEIMKKHRGILNCSNIINNIELCKKKGMHIKINSVITKLNLYTIRRDLINFVKEHLLGYDDHLQIRINVVDSQNRSLKLNQKEIKFLIHEIFLLREALHYRTIIHSNILSLKTATEMVENNLFQYPIWCDLSNLSFYKIASSKHSFEYIYQHSEVLDQIIGKKALLKNKKSYINLSEGVV